MSEGGGFLRNFRLTLASSSRQGQITPVWPVANQAKATFVDILQTNRKKNNLSEQVEVLSWWEIPEALSPQTTQSSRTPPEFSFMPDRLRSEVEFSFRPERFRAPPRSRLSAMLNWGVGSTWVDTKWKYFLSIFSVHLFGRKPGGDNASVNGQEVCLLRLKLVIFCHDDDKDAWW